MKKLSTIVFVRKPQAAVLTPYPATAGMMLLNETLVLAGGTELMVCSRRTLDVLRRADLSDKPLPVKLQDKPTQLPKLKPGELKLKALSVSSEDAEAFAFVSSTGPYFFQIPSNGVEFHRISCEPAAIGAPMMYRPRMATATKLIGVWRRAMALKFLPRTTASQNLRCRSWRLPPVRRRSRQPESFAFDGDTFYVPRSNNVVYAVEGYHGEIKFEVPCANKVSLPPAVIQRGDQVYLGIIDSRGAVQIVDASTRNKERDKGRAFSWKPVVRSGLVAAPEAFIAALDDNTLAIGSFDRRKSKMERDASWKTSPDARDRAATETGQGQRARCRRLLCAAEWNLRFERLPAGYWKADVGSAREWQARRHDVERRCGVCFDHRR